jgi:hypothetical protein
MVRYPTLSWRPRVYGCTNSLSRSWYRSVRAVRRTDAPHREGGATGTAFCWIPNGLPFMSRPYRRRWPRAWHGGLHDRRATSACQRSPSWAERPRPRDMAGRVAIGEAE